MDKHRVFVDFHNADERGCLRLNCVGSVEDLSQQGISLYDGMLLTLYSEDLETDGKVIYSTEENLWVAEIDWNAIKQQDSSVEQTKHQT